MRVELLQAIWSFSHKFPTNIKKVIIWLHVIPHFWNILQSRFYSLKRGLLQPIFDHFFSLSKNDWSWCRHIIFQTYGKSLCYLHKGEFYCVLIFMYPVKTKKMRVFYLFKKQAYKSLLHKTLQKAYSCNLSKEKAAFFCFEQFLTICRGSLAYFMFRMHLYATVIVKSL